MSVSCQIDVHSVAEMEALGRRLGELLFPGAVVALIGPLGAGKTLLVRAIAEGLGVPNRSIVTSPTFILIQEYHGRLPIYHFDAYRLSSAAEFLDLGIDEYYAAGGVCLIEWADKVADCLPRQHLEVRIGLTGESSRRLGLASYGKKYDTIIESIGQSFSK